ncbi:MAG: hypothetical protein MJE68_33800, partial [Proteobacteria bacterium]|nr:hypothetical protein [Pseudomonadota bacterium]
TIINAQVTPSFLLTSDGHSTQSILCQVLKWKKTRLTKEEISCQFMTLIVYGLLYYGHENSEP